MFWVPIESPLVCRHNSYAQTTRNNIMLLIVQLRNALCKAQPSFTHNKWPTWTPLQKSAILSFSHSPTETTPLRTRHIVLKCMLAVIVAILSTQATHHIEMLVCLAYTLPNGSLRTMPCRVTRKLSYTLTYNARPLLLDRTHSHQSHKTPAAYILQLQKLCGYD